MARSKMLRGAFILQAAVLISRFLGLLFTIPFAAIVGTKGIALYGYAYIPYTVVLSLSTLGVPLAVSKFVAKYNASGDYDTGRRLLKSGLLFMTLSGFTAFFVLFLLAPAIASEVIARDAATGNTKEDVILVIRTVSTALIVVPVMSLVRGYFQGFESMGPTGVSQVVEQIVRILFILATSFWVVVVLDGSVTVAVALATFAAFVGAMAGLVVLGAYWKKKRRYLRRLYAESTRTKSRSLKSIYLELMRYALPFVLVGLAIPLYQFVDQFTVNDTLMRVRGFSQIEAERAFAMLTQLVHKLLMVPVSLSTALAVTVIPAITQRFARNDAPGVRLEFTRALQYVLFLTIPAALGLMVLSNEVYGALYGMQGAQMGGHILRWYAPVAVLLALFSVTAATLQGLNEQRTAVFSLLFGLFMKMLLNEPLLSMFAAIGAVMATGCGFFCSVLINFLMIRARTRYRFQFLARRALLIFIFSVMMAFIAKGVAGFTGFGSPDGRGEAVLDMLLGISGGAAVYFWLAKQSGLAEQIFGNQFSYFKKKASFVRREDRS